MFVTSKTMEIYSQMGFLLLWTGYKAFFDEAFPYKMWLVVVPKILVKILTSYLSCILVARVQTAKTMYKILVSCNLRLN